MQYRTVEAIKQNHDAIAERYKVKPSWAIKDEKILGWIHAHIPKDAILLDIGTASGACLAELKKNGYKNVSGIDLDNYLTDVKTEDFVSFSTINLNSEAIPHKDNHFNHIVAFAVLEHLENAFHFARECARVLRPGGYVLITLPNIYRINSGANLILGKNVQGYNNQNDHIMLLTEEIFTKVFTEKFNMVEKFYSQGFVRIPFAGRKIKVRNSRLFSLKVCYILQKK